MILVQEEEEEEEAPEFVAEDEIEESDISDIEVGEHAQRHYNRRPLHTPP